jgi:predicted DNA-binding transcriptional regulator AlpA
MDRKVQGTPYQERDDQYGALAVTDNQFAQMLCVSSRHIWNLEARGEIGPRPVKLGKSRRWALSEIRAWLAAGAPSREAWESRTNA